MNKKDKKVAIIGCGYVGLPLAVEFAKKRKVSVYDPFFERINELKSGVDRNNEIEKSQLIKVETNIHYSSDTSILKNSDIFIVTVPTPVGDDNIPDLSPLISASEIVGEYISHNGIVIYESTVYPGATEDDCIPVIEAKSGLTYKKDFHCGYSPERINPGDKVRTLANTVKIVSASSDDILNEVAELYETIIVAGTYRASSIKVAEAAKLIENIQRDTNIAIINEYSSFLEMSDINSNDVIEAASTKWNFLPFKPGLVGGHCISVDPYYFIYKAQLIGMDPKIVKAARETNNAMYFTLTNWVEKSLSKHKVTLNEAKILIAGFSFKENTSDIRNTKIYDLVNTFKSEGADVDVFDPLCDPAEVKKYYDLDLVIPKRLSYDAVFVAVPHQIFVSKGHQELELLCKNRPIIFDFKSAFPESENIKRL